jgi:hypothetical protein
MSPHPPPTPYLLQVLILMDLCVPLHVSADSKGVRDRSKFALHGFVCGEFASGFLSARETVGAVGMLTRVYFSAGRTIEEQLSVSIYNVTQFDIRNQYIYLLVFEQVESCSNRGPEQSCPPQIGGRGTLSSGAGHPDRSFGLAYRNFLDKFWQLAAIVIHHILEAGF